MIVKMSKVEIVGPKGLLEEVLSFIRETGILQIEPDTIGFIAKEDEDYIKSFLPDMNAVKERAFLEDMRRKIDDLLNLLPEVTMRESYLEPSKILYDLTKTLDLHLALYSELSLRRGAIREELEELRGYERFLRGIESLIPEATEIPDVELIGITIRDLEAIAQLRIELSDVTRDRFELVTTSLDDGTVVGLISVTEKDVEGVRRILSDERFPEMRFPETFKAYPFPEKIRYIREKTSGLSNELQTIEAELERFACGWRPIYTKVKEWINERFSVLSATAYVFETRMCFIIYGWMPKEKVPELKEKLDSEFSGRVILEEKGMVEEDLERVPIMLRNPPYFKPFELFTRILPLPRYTSYDSTPFIGIFFPIFFGMILGDAGYGLFLAIISVILLRVVRLGRTVRDAVTILLISSGYTIFFGLLYGEFFGELGHRLFGLKPICIERRTAVIPMLYFTISVGIIHILIGLILGFVYALKRKTKSEAIVKFLNIVMILFVLAFVASIFEILPKFFTKPVIIAMLIIIPFLFFLGGILAPLEFLKNIGNIISYVRIMAIGLMSVLLAFTANRLGGLTGDIMLGIIVAGLLHILNIVVGVFSPTIHSLRLHYVEFFGKFIEHGGRRYEPLEKKD